MPGSVIPGRKRCAKKKAVCSFRALLKLYKRRFSS